MNLMSKKKFSTTRERDLTIAALYEDLNSMNEVAKRVGVSKGTVYNVLKKLENEPEDERIINEIKKTVKERNEEETADILELIKGARVTSIVGKAINMLDSDETLKQQIEKYGIQGITNMVGMLVDKSLKLQSMELERQNLELKNKELSNTRYIVIEGENDDQEDSTELSETYS